MKQLLTEADFQHAAKSSKLEAAVIKAVSEVESKGKGFDDQDRVTILFERHKFSKFTGGKYDAKYPDISNKKAGGYGKLADQYPKFSRAFKLDPHAALMSCSWGKFQIMGFNFPLCGFKTVDDFVDAMKESERSQLEIFLEYIQATGLKHYLENHDWTNFARFYNGADYKKNDYDTKLKAAYNKFK